VAYVTGQWKASTKITQGSYVSKQIRPYFDHMILTEIKPLHIVAFMQHLAAKRLGIKTQRNIYAVLTTMFSHAHEQELIDRSPIKRKQAPKLPKHEKAALTREQGWLLWDALADAKLIRYRAFYGTLLFTQVRTGEALGIRWEDVDFANRVIHIRRAIYRGRPTSRKTDGSIRDRRMNSELYTALMNHRAMSHYTAPTDYVFASSSGRPMNPDQLRENLQAVLRNKLHVHLGAT